MTVRNVKTGCLCRLRKRSPPDVVYTPFDVTSSSLEAMSSLYDTAMQGVSRSGMESFRKWCQ